MAQKINVTLVDDIDGGDADETVTFALDGTSYEIDLSAANAARLRDTFATYVGSARRAGRGSGAGGARKSAGRRGGASLDRSQVQHVRQWARDNGLKVSERGRISADILAKYQAAH